MCCKRFHPRGSKKKFRKKNLKKNYVCDPARALKMSKIRRFSLFSKIEISFAIKWCKIVVKYVQNSRNQFFLKISSQSFILAVVLMELAYGRVFYSVLNFYDFLDFRLIFRGPRKRGTLEVNIYRREI